MTDSFIVHTARGNLADGRQVVCEDWPDAATAQAALAKCLSWHWPAPSYADDVLDTIADGLAVRLEVDLSRPFGCSLRLLSA